MKTKALILIATTILFSACNRQAEKEQAAINHQLPKENVMMKAMDQSMANMHKAKQTGNADYDFAAMMIPHHEGAIAMAEALLKDSKSTVLIAFAKKVITAQKQEIKTLNAFLISADQSPSANAGTFKKELNNSMMPMMEGMNKVTLSNNADKDFTALMIPHHESAVAMAKAYLPYAKNEKIKGLAKIIIEAQEKEIKWLKAQ